MHPRVVSQPNVNSQHTCVHALLLESCFPFPTGARFSLFRLLFHQLPQMQSHRRISYTNTALPSPGCSPPCSRSSCLEPPKETGLAPISHIHTDNISKNQSSTTKSHRIFRTTLFVPRPTLPSLTYIWSFTSFLKAETGKCVITSRAVRKEMMCFYSQPQVLSAPSEQLFSI